MIEVSIVSGTYNRLPHMKRMVASARYSVSPLSYEIILVDGGSTDGTIEWCKKQADITIIEQGELLGAVKAFNTGARAAKGRYVVLGNDDIEFVGRSILRSWTFMEDYKTIGVGCFYQDRNRRPWHVETMPAVGSGRRQVAVPYGQVCIVPRWLGDKVGWWGDYLHTYGGDNELTANILELGYEAYPIDGAKIHDFSEDLDDELRRINNDDPRSVAASGGTHPDSYKWYQKWTFRKKVGPVLRLSPATPPELPDKSLRILYAPIYEPGNTFQRGTKVGLRKSLEKIGVVLESDYMEKGIAKLREDACSICPNIFILQIQDAKVFNVATMTALRKNHPEATFVSWNGDYHPENLHDPAYISLMKEMDVATFAVSSIQQKYEDVGINWMYWQIGYEEFYAEPDQATKHYDVVFLGNGYTEWRKDLARFLLSYRDPRTSRINIGLYGSWPKGWANGSNLYDFDSGRQVYRAAKLAISDQQWPTATGYVSNRLFQAMAAGGCMVLQQRFDGMEEYLGLVPGKHLDIWENLDDLGEKIGFWLKEKEKRKEIAEAGHKYMIENHSFDVRVQELMSVLER